MCPVSIHAPTRGATEARVAFFDERLFQSTHPRGVRPALGGYDVKVTIVSIHAPTRGATCTAWGRRPPRPFQSTHPRGVRRGPARASGTPSGFNPRTHAGCDSRAPPQETPLSVFQSTHPRGVRQVGPIIGPLKGVSIHAPTRGATG